MLTIGRSKKYSISKMGVSVTIIAESSTSYVAKFLDQPLRKPISCRKDAKVFYFIPVVPDLPT